jgi:hypothetical protein
LCVDNSHMPTDDLIFPSAPFHQAREHIHMLVKALAYAATDPDGGVFVRAFLMTVEARRLLNEAQYSVKERVES